MWLRKCRSVCVLRGGLSPALWEAANHSHIPTSWLCVFSRRELCRESHLTSDLNDISGWGLSPSRKCHCKYSAFSLGGNATTLPHSPKPVLSFPSQAPISADNEAEQPADVMQYGLIVYLWLISFPSCFKAPKSPGTTRKDNIGKNAWIQLLNLKTGPWIDTWDIT